MFNKNYNEPVILAYFIYWISVHNCLLLPCWGHLGPKGVVLRWVHNHFDRRSDKRHIMITIHWKLSYRDINTLYQEGWQYSRCDAQNYRSNHCQICDKKNATLSEPSQKLTYSGSKIMSLWLTFSNAEGSLIWHFKWVKCLWINYVSSLSQWFLRKH